VTRDSFGFSISFGSASVSACAKRIEIITLATQEAELYGYAQDAHALRFTQLLVEFLGHTVRLPSPIHTDSAAAMPFILRPGATAHTRHYEKFLLFSDVSSALTACPSLYGLRARTFVPTSSRRRSTRHPSSGTAPASSELRATSTG